MSVSNVCIPPSNYFDRFTLDESNLSVVSLVSRIKHVREARMQWREMLKRLKIQSPCNCDVKFLDDVSREIVQSISEDSIPNDCVRFLTLWFALPMLRRCTKEDDEEDDDTASSLPSPQKRMKRLKEEDWQFVPRATINGKTVLLPFIWIHLEDDDDKCNLPKVIVKESSIVYSGYRVVLADTSKNRNARCIAKVDLPVYKNRERPLVFTPPVSSFQMAEFKKRRPLKGSVALLAQLIETENSAVRHREDGICMESGEYVFEIDLTICWDVRNNRLMSVHGTHADQDAIYYVLVTCEKDPEERLYLFHVDQLRDTSESTGLDVCYRYPLVKEGIERMNT